MFHRRRLSVTLRRYIDVSSLLSSEKATVHWSELKKIEDDQQESNCGYCRWTFLRCRWCRRDAATMGIIATEGVIELGAFLVDSGRTQHCREAGECLYISPTGEIDWWKQGTDSGWCRELNALSKSSAGALISTIVPEDFSVAAGWRRNNEGDLLSATDWSLRCEKGSPDCLGLMCGCFLSWRTSQPTCGVLPTGRGGTRRKTGRSMGGTYSLCCA